MHMTTLHANPNVLHGAAAVLVACILDHLVSPDEVGHEVRCASGAAHRLMGDCANSTTTCRLWTYLQFVNVDFIANPVDVFHVDAVPFADVMPSNTANGQMLTRNGRLFSCEPVRP